MFDEPYTLEERRQAAWDTFVDSLPHCSVCGKPIMPGYQLYRTVIRKKFVTFCEDCFVELSDSREIYASGGYHR